MIEFAVVTKTAEAPYGGTMGLRMDLYAQTEVPSKDNHWEGKVEPLDLDFTAELGVMTPVFEVGEIVIVDFDTHAELAPPHRRLTEWTVSYETFKTASEALARSREVVAEKVS